MRTGAFNLVMVDDNDVDAEVVERSIRASAWDIDFRRFATCEEASPAPSGHTPGSTSS